MAYKVTYYMPDGSPVAFEDRNGKLFDTPEQALRFCLDIEKDIKYGAETVQRLDMTGSVIIFGADGSPKTIIDKIR